jgi:UTP-glucose-1-phosphate uridylyltransferase
MDKKKRIEELEDEIIELKYQLKESKKNELIYKDLLYNIEISIKDMFKREEESERFNLGEIFNFREALLNLKKSLDEYKKLYKLRF